MKIVQLPTVSTKAPIRGTAILTIELPAGTVRHPALLDAVEREVGRICALDHGVDGVRVAYAARGQSSLAAATDARTVADRLLGFLGLTRTSVVEDQLFLRTKPELKIVPEFDRSDGGSTPTP